MLKKPYSGIIERYGDRLPVKTTDVAVSLAEGNTPLIPLRNMDLFDQKRINAFVKYEGSNPTGSFKDRGMTVAVTRALSAGSDAVICASTGNTSAAAAAYARRAGIRAFVLIPEKKIAAGKLAQALIYGARIIQIAGNFDDGMCLVKEVAEDSGVTIVNSINPHRLQGQKTAAFEIVDALGDAPDYHYLPVGNAGNISAYWMGYSEYYAAGIATSRPILAGYQAKGAAPFVHNATVDKPQTIATAIRIGNPQSWDLAVKAQQESHGWFGMRSDEEILTAQSLLAVREGIFCEPASAVSVAGLLNDVRTGRIPDHSSVVCTLTGNGLKDPDIAVRQSAKGDALITVPAERSAVRDAILLKAGC